MGNIGVGELVLILLIVLLIFGAKRLPDVAKGLGKSFKSFKEGMSEKEEDPDTKEKK